MVYENDTLQFFGHPEGRVVVQGGVGGGYEYQYAYTDHLGNVRMLYTSNPESVTFTATMETEANEQEDDGLFTNVDETNAVDTGATSYNEVSRLFSSQPIGPGISLPMYPGDKATMSVKAYHRGGSDFNNTIDLNTFITTLAGVFGGVNGGTAAEQTTFDAFDNALNAPGFGLQGTTLATRPAAYLNYILFDKNMKMYQHGHAQISKSGTLETLSLADIEATKEGWIYVYLSNESNSLNEVYFDDMVVTIQESMVVQNTDYYPFGLSFNTSWTRPTDLKNNFLYNAGSELNEKTKNYETYFRDYDPALGRMSGVDIMAGKYSSLSPYQYAFNDPVAWNDPSGADPDFDFGDYIANHDQYQAGRRAMDQNHYRASPFSSYHWTNNVLRSAESQQRRDYFMMNGSDFADKWNQSTSDYIFDLARSRASRSMEAFASVGFEVVSSQSYDPDLAYSMMPVHTLLMNGVFVTSLGADFFSDNMGPIRGTAGGFGSGFIDGFGGGAMSTWNLLSNDLWTGGFWLDQAQLGLDLMTGKALFDAAEGAADFAQKVPNMSSYELGYATGFGVEKAVEAALVTKGAGMVRGALSASRMGGGAARIQKYGHLWQEASLEKAIQRHAGSNATSWTSKTGKIIYENPASGRQVVVDPAGYFRIFQPSTFGATKGTYLDMLGKLPAPARYLKGGAIGNVPLSGSELNQATHFLFR